MNPILEEQQNEDFEGGLVFKADKKEEKPVDKSKDKKNSEEKKKEEDEEEDDDYEDPWKRVKLNPEA